MGMNIRKPASGNRNIVDSRVTEGRSAAGMLQKDLLARLQVTGVGISPPALLLLEGEERPVSDIEFKALAEILNVDVRWLLFGWMWIIIKETLVSIGRYFVTIVMIGKESTSIGYLASYIGSALIPWILCWIINRFGSKKD